MTQTRSNNDQAQCEIMKSTMCLENVKVKAYGAGKLEGRVACTILKPHHIDQEYRVRQAVHT